MAFKGWKAEALEFFDGLAADNSKPYWERHKAEYLELVRAPMEELLGELEADWGEGTIFRPYRDVRFSADKSPYKDHIGARVGADCYVQLGADGLAVGSGMWEMASDQLERYREAVARDRTGRALEALAATARTGGVELMSHATLKTAPRGYPKDHPRVELLRYKGLATWRSWPPAAWLGTARAKDRVVGFFEASAPIVGWLHANVGPSTMPADRR